MHYNNKFNVLGRIKKNKLTGVIPLAIMLALSTWYEAVHTAWDETKAQVENILEKESNLKEQIREIRKKTDLFDVQSDDGSFLFTPNEVEQNDDQKIEVDSIEDNIKKIRNKMDLFKVSIKWKEVWFEPDTDSKNVNGDFQEQIKEIRKKTDLFKVEITDGNLSFIPNDDQTTVATTTVEEQIKDIKKKTDIFKVENIDGNLIFTLDNDWGGQNEKTLNSSWCY